MSAPTASALEILAGWRYVVVAFDDDSELADRHVELFDSFTASVLGDHRYRLFRHPRRLVIGVAPPAADAVGRLREAMHGRLHGVDDPDVDAVELN